MLGPILCGLVAQAPLLPKLRGHFAEFLNNASPVGLRILSSSTCVGLRYRFSWHDSGFSRRLAHLLRYPLVRSTSHIPVTTGGFASLSGTLLVRGFHPAVRLSTRVPTVLIMRSTGISTCYPSTTTFVLALGPDLPRADQLYSGNLRYSARRILTFVSLLIPAFSLPRSPRLLTVTLRSSSNAPLPIINDS